MANQLVRRGSGVGANYRAAQRAESNRDFTYKQGSVEEECDETSFWKEAAIELELVTKELVDDLLKEANELLSITVASIKTAEKRI